MSELNNTGAGQWSETDASNTSASPNGWPSGTFPNQVEGIGQATMGAIKRFWDRINGTVTSSGSANAYVYTPANVSFPTQYVAGEIYTWKANFTNTGASTININGLGGKNIFQQTSAGPAALAGGEIVSGQMVQTLYDGTQMQMVSPAANVAPGASTAWTPSYSGFSANPLSAVATTMKIGKRVFVEYRDTANGTSNSVNFTIAGLTYPTAATTPAIPVLVTNGGVQTTGTAQISGSTITLTLGAATGGGGFTASGSKACSGISMSYETT